MCLYVLKRTGVRTLKTSMTVYKIITADNASPYKGFLYSPGEIYTNSKLRIVNRSYDAKHGAEFGGFVVEGFHAYVDAFSAKIHRDDEFAWAKVAAFTIPKGAEVVYGKCKQIVSDVIIAGNLEDIGRTA